MTQTLEVEVTAPVASFRNPLYAGVQLTLPCPPPATVGGMLAAAAGGWDQVDSRLTFAMAFRAKGRGVDFETYHPLAGKGPKATPNPRDREFLADVMLTVWLTDEIDLWGRRLRRPVWPLRLGRSQDLVGVRTRTVDLVARPGLVGGALLPEDVRTVEGAIPRGTVLRLPTAISLDRTRHHWAGYRFDPTGAAPDRINAGMSTPDGQAVVTLPPVHPVHAPGRVL